MQLHRRQKRDQLRHIVRIACLTGLSGQVVVLSTDQTKMLEVAVAAIWVRPAIQDLMDKRSSGIDQFVIIFENANPCHANHNRNLRIRMPAFKPLPIVLLDGMDNFLVQKPLRQTKHGCITKNGRCLCQKIRHPAMLSCKHLLHVFV